MLIKYSSIVCMWNKWKCIFGIFSFSLRLYVFFFLIVSRLRARLIKPKKVRSMVVTVLRTSEEVRACGCAKSSAREDGRIWVSAEYGASFETIQNSNWVTFSSSTRLVWQGVNGTVLGQSRGIVDVAFVIGKSFFVEKSNRTLFTLLRFATVIVSILIVHRILSVHHIK